jgi:Uma2 family endonuclease
MTDTATKFTRHDYLRLPEGFPCELIDGKFVKEPSPVYRHQRVGMRLVEQLVSLIGSDRCVASPIDLFVDEFNVLQPDVAAFAAALSRDVVHIPVPAVVFEILSPSTERRDRQTKSRIYLRAGVAEVWLIDPETGRIDVLTSAGSRTFSREETPRSTSLPGFELRGADLIL